MKAMIKCLLLLMFSVVVAMPVQAQRNRQQKKTREQLAEVQAKNIAGQMAMDEATTTKFVTVFCNYKREVWALGKGKPKGKVNNTEEEAKNAINCRFERSQKMLDIRKRYYKEYSTFLTQKQIEQVYKLERRQMKRMANKRKERRGR